jgi:hypothetical protein
MTANTCRKINTHLDKLQEDLMKELTEAEKQVTTETHELHVSLDEKQRKLTEYQSNIANKMSVDFCSQFLYFILDVSFLFF